MCVCVYVCVGGDVMVLIGGNVQYLGEGHRAIFLMYVLVYIDLCVTLNVNCSLIVHVYGYIVCVCICRSCVICVLSNAQDKFLLKETIKSNLIFSLY